MRSLLAQNLYTTKLITDKYFNMVSCSVKKALNFLFNLSKGEKCFGIGKQCQCLHQLWGILRQRGRSSVGRASDSGCEGSRFEPRRWVGKKFLQLIKKFPESNDTRCLVQPSRCLRLTGAGGRDQKKKKKMKCKQILLRRYYYAMSHWHFINTTEMISFLSKIPNFILLTVE